MQRGVVKLNKAELEIIHKYFAKILYPTPGLKEKLKIDDDKNLPHELSEYEVEQLIDSFPPPDPKNKEVAMLRKKLTEFLFSMRDELAARSTHKLPKIK